MLLPYEAGGARCFRPKPTELIVHTEDFCLQPVVMMLSFAGLFSTRRK